jgi:hypothetical protein
MKRVGIKRPQYTPPPPAPPRPATRRSQMVASCFEGSVPKEPADRAPKFKLLAEGEECTVRRYAGYCRCAPETVVLAHTNTLSDQKGERYKGHDSAGFFAGHECHDYIDNRRGPPHEIEALVLAAQQRTRTRLREIAASPTARPWRKLAAIEVLMQLESRNG